MRPLPPNLYNPIHNKPFSFPIQSSSGLLGVPPWTKHCIFSMPKLVKVIMQLAGPKKGSRLPRTSMLNVFREQLVLSSTDLNCLKLNRRDIAPNLAQHIVVVQPYFIDAQWILSEEARLVAYSSD